MLSAVNLTMLSRPHDTGVLRYKPTQANYTQTYSEFFGQHNHDLVVNQTRVEYLEFIAMAHGQVTSAWMHWFRHGT